MPVLLSLKYTWIHSTNMRVAEIGIIVFLDGQLGCGDRRLQQFSAYGLGLGL